MFATLPVRDSVILVFIFGMVSATVLEYFTGYVMEQTFKVRYWDYTIQPFNLNGYICLGCSLAWGVASELLIFLMHKPIEKMVVSIDDAPGSILASIFGVYFVTDLYVSAREAFDLKKIIVEAIESNENIKRLGKRIDVYLAFAEEDKQKFLASVEKLKDAGEKKKMSIAFDIEEAKLEFYEKLQYRKEERDLEISKFKEELREARERYAKRLEKARDKSASRILRRNPGAYIKKAEITIEEILERFKA